MYRNLNPQNLLLFVAGWLLIYGSYSITKFLVSYLIKGDMPVKTGFQIVIYTGGIFSVIMLSFTIYLFATNFSKLDNPVDPVKWFDILIPMLISTMYGMFSAIRKHNNYLYELYSKEYFDIK